jgi:guanylate kinase
MIQEPINFDVFHTKPLVVVISGPSGVGKDAVLQSLKEGTSPFYYVVTATSRPIRSMEKEGIDYHFVSKVEFERMIHDEELLEYAIVYDDYKGVPRAEVEKGLSSGKDVVLRLDVQGAAKIRSLFPQDSILIFLLPTNEAEWYDRLVRRGTETEVSLNLRRNTAIQEMQRLFEFDYVVVNAEDRLKDTVRAILDIIKVEHQRINLRNINV